MNPTVPRVMYEMITPAMAGRYLLANTKNRTPRETAIKRYAVQMTAGLWKLTGDTIAAVALGFAMGKRVR